METTKLNIPFRIILVLLVLSISSCKKNEKPIHTTHTGIPEVTISYAKGFSIQQFSGYKLLHVTEAFPGMDKTFTYALIPQESALPDMLVADAIIRTPVKSIVVTSTTHIPSLEMLGVEDKLVGFPNLDYISSEKTRKRINQNLVAELGQNESINTETTLALDPDVVVSFGITGENTALKSLVRAGIPVLYNGDWVEQNPLGKAEWIKFFGALFEKEALADSLFTQIATKYNAVKKLSLKAKEKPSVLSGALFKDVWYLPKGESWAGKLIADANANYLYKQTSGSGSLSLSIEEVLDKGQEADFWIAPNAFTSFTQLRESNAAYTQFKAFKEHNIYGFGDAKGETGGLLYYELGPNRPDLILQDLVHIFHPELLPDYEPYFFKPLHE